jgi:subtilisin family serine protease
VDIDAERAWTYATGAGVTIAVLDSGVQLDHPDLVVVPGHDYIDQDDDPGPAPGSDEGPHGTCAAGVAAAVGDNTYGVAGVAYGADIYAVRLIGGDTTLDDLYNAFVESVDAGAGVLSNSWGFGTACETVPRYGVFADMFDYAEETGRGGLGSVVVFAAGNGACDIENDHMLGHETAVVVAAIESWDQRAWYSSYGDAVDIAAPTTLLTTDLTEGGYGSYDGDDAFVDGFNGTSAATPVVAGVVALMMEANPRITAAAIRDVLCATAVRTDVANAGYDADGRSPYYGCGRIDAGAAVEAVADTAPDAPEPALVADEVVVGRAVLAWEAAADPDGDVSGYEVSWWRIGGGDDTDPIEETLVPVAGTSLDLGAELDVGDGVTWKVRAVDPWGAGPWSAEQAFTVVAEETAPPPEQESGCRHTSGAGMGGLALAALGLARRRRR